MDSMSEQLAEIREKVFRPGAEAEVPEQPHDLEDEIEDIQPEEPEEVESEEGQSEETLGDTFDVAELAEAIGVDPDYLYQGLKLTLRKGDSNEVLSFSEIKDRLQEVESGGSEILQQKQSLESERQQFHNFAQQWNQAAQQVSEEEYAALGAMKAAEAEYQRLAQLEQTDPDRFEKEERRLTRQYALAKQAYEESSSKRTQLNQAQFQQAATWHAQQLRQRVPEWKSTETAEKETGEIGEYLVSQGFSPEELMQRIDFRQRIIDRKAWLWDRHQSEIQGAKSKVKKAPRTLAPGKGVQRTNVKELRRLKDRAKASRGQPDHPDVLAAAKAVMKSR